MPAPRLVSTWSFALRGHAAAWPALRDGGSALDAVETVCRTIEADEEVDSVGRGGLPDRRGRMTLDAAVMLGPRRYGALAAARRSLHPVTVARRLMERDEAAFLAGDGADRFAAAEGFPRDPLCTPLARRRWRKWRRDGRIPDQVGDGGIDLRPVDTGVGRLFADADEAAQRHHDTIGALGIGADGVLAVACSTSGLPFKRPGRVGDSPLVGHGLYCDPAVGASTATGTGELVMGVCGAFLAVERLRMGDDPLDAAVAAVRRIADGGPIQPRDQVAICVLRADGEWAAASLRSGFRAAVTDAERDDAVAPGAVVLEE